MEQKFEDRSNELRRIQLIPKVNFGIKRADYITLEGIKN